MKMKQRIQEWFEAHDGESEFFVSPSDYPFSIVAPSSNADTFVYCTKSHCLNRFNHQLADDSGLPGIIRSGLPSESELPWLRSQIEGRRLVFLDDADPVDLLIFAWLRESLPIEHLGLSDKLLAQCGVELCDRITIQLSEAELAAMPLLTDCLHDVASLLGPSCAALVAGGRKVEVEVLNSFATCTPLELKAALLGRK